MSDICTVKKSTLDGIAKAIQSKTGESGRMLPSEMRGKIENLPSQPTKGLVFSEYDSDGYPHKAEFVGSWTEIPQNFLWYAQGRNTWISRVTRLAIPDGVVEIENSAFQNLPYITDLELPNNDIRVRCAGFQLLSITQLNVKKNVTMLSSQCFDGFLRMTSAIFGGEVNEITNQCFRNANACMLYDFSHCTSIPPLYNTTNSLGHATGCVIRIPSALSDQTLGTGNGWESATNWSGLTNIVWEVV